MVSQNASPPSGLFETTSLVEGLELPNRLVRSATWEGLAAADGSMTPALIDWYRRLAAGGVGLIISSYVTVHRQGRQLPGQIGAHDDTHVAGLRSLAEAVHDKGNRIVAQIVHCGGQSTRAVMGGLDPLAPSAVTSPGYPERPKELEPDQIAEIIAAFAQAAGRLQDAGFDGVQLHGAHGYLLSEFLSPSRNQRTDAYGGSLEGRMRFGLEVTRAVRERVGPSFPLMIKLNANDFLPGSTTEEDAGVFAQQLVAAGLDAIEVSGGTPGSGKLGAARPNILIPADEAYFLPQAKAIRAAVPDTPLILVGGLRTPEVMKRILTDGHADYFAMSRPLIRDPELPSRWQKGEDAAAGCVSCLGCFGPARRGEGLRCVKASKPPG